jgi:hypothetical protein
MKKLVLCFDVDTYWKKFTKQINILPNILIYYNNLSQKRIGITFDWLFWYVNIELVQIKNLKFKGE